jgi:hypothetical protein
MSDLSKCGDACNCVGCQAKVIIDTLPKNSAHDLLADREAVKASIKFVRSVPAGERIHKLTKLLIDDPYLSCAENRIDWVMQSQFRDLGEDTIIKIVTYVSLFK